MLNSLKISIKKAIRLISFKNKFEHTTPLFISKDILPFHDLVKYRKGSLIWKVSNGYIQEPLCSVFKKNVYNPHRFNVSIPKKTKVGKNRFQFSCARNWNSIPVHIRSITTLQAFNMNYRNHLLHKLEAS